MSDSQKNNLKFILAQLPLLGASGYAVSQGYIHDMFTTLASMALALLYEVSMAGVAFGKDVLAKNREKWVEESANSLDQIVHNFLSWLKKGIQNRFSRFRRRYNEQMNFDHRFFNVSGLKTRGGKKLQVERVFVELKMAHNDPNQANLNPIAQKFLSGSQEIWAFVRQLEAMAIIGAPGSGKTTLLQHIALTFAHNHQRKQGLAAATPIFLYLRNHVATLTAENPPNLAELVQKHFSDSKNYPDLNPPPDWFERELSAGRCIILLDGLDEVAQQSQRRQVSVWVDKQIKIYRRCRFIITARPMGYRKAPLNEVQVLEVLPFSPQQVKQFIQNWYLETKIITAGLDDAGIRRDAQRDSEDLLRRLQTHHNLDILTVNPLLLTMIANVHNYHGGKRLPENRVALYDEICNVFLDDWQRDKAEHLQDKLNAQQKRAVLQPLAAFMMQAQSRLVSRNQALSLMSTYLERAGLLSEAERADFLSTLQASGLFLESEANEWSFAHLTFQEYLCAVHWKETTPPTAWADLVVDSWWHETLCLYAAQSSDATALAQACLALNTRDSLTLVVDLEQEAAQLEPTTRQAIRQQLDANLESPDPALRRLAAEVKLSRRLKQDFYPLDDHRAIGKTLITCAEYQLFLDETRAKDNYHQPDHWTDYTFPAGQAKQPISGLWPRDAKAFCAWLSQRTGQNYRLPHETELADFKGDLPPNTTTWLETGTLHPLPTQTTQTLLQNLSQLTHTILPQPISLNFSDARSLNRVHALDLSLIHNRVRTIALIFKQNYASPLEIFQPFDFIHNRSLAFIRDIVRDFENIHKHTHDIVLGRGFTYDINLKLERSNLASIYQFVMLELVKELTQTQIESLHFLANAIQISQVNDFATWRQAQWQLAALICLYVYLSNERLAKTKKRAWWQFWRNTESEWQTRQQEYLQLYWLFQTLRLRAEGKLPAWEGLLLVREEG